MEINILGIAGVASITVICYLCGEIANALPLENKWIPIICGVIGAVLGAVGLYYVPGFPASDPLNAVAVGIVSGLAATGMDQLVKQLKQ